MKQRSPLSIRTRRSLLSGIKDADNHESWREFYDTYWRFVYGVARKAGLTEEEANDAVQETFCHVAKSIPKFRYDPAIGSFKSWLLHTTRWHIIDQFRARAREGERVQSRDDPSRRTALIERIPDPRGSVLDQLYEQDWKDNLQAAALERVKRRVKPKQYQAYHLYSVKALPLSEVTARIGVTPNQVYLAKHRIGKLVAQEVKRLEREIL